MSCCLFVLIPSCSDAKLSWWKIALLPSCPDAILSCCKVALLPSCRYSCPVLSSAPRTDISSPSSTKNILLEPYCPGPWQLNWKSNNAINSSLKSIRSDAQLTHAHTGVSWPSCPGDQLSWAPGHQLFRRPSFFGEHLSGRAVSSTQLTEKMIPVLQKLFH